MFLMLEMASSRFQLKNNDHAQMSQRFGKYRWNYWLVLMVHYPLATIVSLLWQHLSYWNKIMWCRTLYGRLKSMCDRLFTDCAAGCQPQQCSTASQCNPNMCQVGYGYVDASHTCICKYCGFKSHKSISNAFLTHSDKSTFDLPVPFFNFSMTTYNMWKKSSWAIVFDYSCYAVVNIS